MFAAAWFIARKDVKYLLQKRETIMWTFLMPIVFFYFIGTITGGFSGGGRPVDRVAFAAPDDAGFLAGALERRLVGAGYTVVKPADSTFAGVSRRLTVPAHFTDSILAARAETLRFVRTGEGIGADYDKARLSRAAYSLLADVVVAAENGAVSEASLNEVAAEPRNIHLEVAPAGRRREIPTGFTQAIPGTMVMFTLLVLLTSSAVLLVVERREGLLRRLAATPISRSQIVLGKWGGRMMLAIVQLAFAMAAGTLLFRMNWGPNLGMVGLLLLAYAGFNAALGLMLGSIVRNEAQAVGIGVLSSNVLAALGGCWWPIEVTPQWMQHLALFLPTGVAMDALHRLVNFQLGASSVVPHVAVLAVAALIAGWGATRLFKFQ